MKSLKNYIPNAITSLNLFSGTLASIFIVEGHLQIGAFLLLAAAFFDFCDGFVARALKAYSPMGKELDSLADMVSFGVAPGLILLMLLKNAWGMTQYSPVEAIMAEPLKLVPALIVPVFSGLRLAKFNVDERQTSSFIGLPTPANALLLTALGWASMGEKVGFFYELSQNSMFLVSVGLLGSYLLVSEIPMFSLKFKSFKWQDNKLRFLFLVVSLVLIIWGGFPAISLVILLYVLISYVAGRIFKVSF